MSSGLRTAVSKVVGCDASARSDVSIPGYREAAAESGWPPAPRGMPRFDAAAALRLMADEHIRHLAAGGIGRRQRLAAYKYPSWIEFTDTLPMTASGEILERELRVRDRRERTGVPAGSDH